MEAVYRLNTSELGNDFINSVKFAYPESDVEIMVREQNETDYLNSSFANREHLEKAIANVEQGKVISFDSVEQAVRCAEERAAQ